MSQTINLTVANTIYLMATGFTTYSVFKFMSVFFDREEVPKGRELGSYCGYFVLISTVYLTFKSPQLTLISNLLLFLALSYNYRATFKSRLIAVIFMYAILLSAEVMTQLMLMIVGIDHFTQYDTKEFVVAQICIQLIAYMVVLLFSNFKLVKDQMTLPWLQWVAVIAVPLCTVLPVAEMLLVSNDDNALLLTSITLIVFVINIFMFYLYDVLTNTYRKMFDTKLLQQENAGYIKQMEIMNHAMENQRLLRHDFKNHMAMLKSLMASGNVAEAEQYVDHIIDSVAIADAFKSGNDIVDSMINYKMQEARRGGVRIMVEAQLPPRLEIAPFDLNIVISNLLDNALHAVALLEDPSYRIVRVNIEFSKNCLYIVVSNPFKEENLVQDDKIQSAHAERVDHGLGLVSVRKAIKKYDGDMVISVENANFINEIILCNKKV